MDNKKSCTTQLVKERNQSSKKVKLCGYLKKKRNKVGGWRKMWFVLQDKLLLSYASKEEYDNKLVSFKDVLNLVPGTLVRPLGGFRFTIETTSHAMYTFHCDDRNAYREWIAVLLDSLDSGQSQASSTGLVQRFQNISADNIPYALRFNAALQTQRHRDMSNSCDSIRRHIAGSAERECHQCYTYELADAHLERVELPTSAPLPLPLPLPLSCVRLPIARSTAKILERNGVNSSGLPLPLTTATATALQQQTTNCCSRNNGTQSTGTNVGSGHFRLHRSYSNNNNEASSEELLQNRAQHPVAIINRMFQQPLTNEEVHSPVNGEPQSGPVAVRRAGCDRDEHQRWPSDQRVFLWEKNAQERQLDSGETCSCSSNEGKALDMVRDKIQRMSIKGCKESSVDDTVEAVEQHERSKLITTNRVEEIVMEKVRSEVEHSKAVDATPPPEPIYAVVDLQHKYKQRKLRNHRQGAELNRCNSYDSIMQSPVGEYAATDRMRRHEKSASSLIDDDIDGIYEDGDALFNNNGASGTADDENIYEPINVPTTQPKAFWKYFTRLKVNSLLHLTRMRKSGNATYDTIQVPVPSLIASTTSTKPMAITSAQSSTASQFSSIKRKFGTHRKSMQVRVRKLCARAYEPKPFFKHHKPHHLQPQMQLQQQQQQEHQTHQCNSATVASSALINNHNNNNKKSKYRWKSVKIRPKYLNAHGGTKDDSKAEKQHFFGSLPHLRKARTSIFAANNLHLTKGDNASSANNSNTITNST